MHLGDVPFLVAVGVASTAVQWFRITFVNDREAVNADYKVTLGYPLRAFHSHKVEPVGPVMNALNTVDRIKIVRWTINWVFLAHNMSKDLPLIGLDTIKKQLNNQKKMIDFNTDFGFVKKSVDVDQVDFDALKALYEKITECLNDREAYGEIRHIIRHTPVIRVPDLDSKGNLQIREGKIVWVTHKIIKAKRTDQKDRLTEVPPVAFNEPILESSVFGSKITVCLTPLGYRRAPKTNFEILEALKAVLSALKFIHRNGFVHRDLRWPNIVRLSDASWMLIDLENVAYADQPWPEPGVLAKQFWPANDEPIWKKHHDLKMLAALLDNVEGKTWTEFNTIQANLREDNATAEDVLAKLGDITIGEILFGEEVEDEETSIRSSFAKMLISSESDQN